MHEFQGWLHDLPLLARQPQKNLVVNLISTAVRSRWRSPARLMQNRLLIRRDDHICATMIVPSVNSSEIVSTLRASRRCEILPLFPDVSIRHRQTTAKTNQDGRTRAPESLPENVLNHRLHFDYRAALRDICISTLNRFCRRCIWPQHRFVEIHDCVAGQNASQLEISTFAVVMNVSGLA